jgi:hypothetical protein
VIPITLLEFDIIDEYVKQANTQYSDETTLAK